MTNLSEKFSEKLSSCSLEELNTLFDMLSEFENVGPLMDDYLNVTRFNMNYTQSYDFYNNDVDFCKAA